MSRAEQRYKSTIPSVLQEQGRSVAWFCRRVGISRALFYRWVDGSRGIAPQYRHRCAEVLGIPESVLFLPTESLVGDISAHDVTTQEVA